MPPTNDHDEGFKPGLSGCGCMAVAGMGMMVVLPVVTLLAAGFHCLILDLCFMVTYPVWTGIVSAFIGLCLGAVLAYGRLAGSHRNKQKAAQTQARKKLYEERRRRLEEAHLRWLEAQKEEYQDP